MNHDPLSSRRRPNGGVAQPASAGSALEADEDASQDLPSGPPPASSSGGEEDPEPLDGEPRAGDRLGDYVLAERIGRGSMGEVWRAQGPEGEVAVKIPRRPAFLRHLRREGFLLAAVEHPNVARFIAAELEGPRPFLVTECVRGRPLRALCTGTLPPSAITRLGDQILAGLEAIHAAGVLHLDLKPENVIVPEDGERGGRLKIVDLGLGKATTRLMEELYLSVSLASRNPAVAGTLAYMSPEQRRGRALDVRSDLFAFGILLHELLTGRLPEPGRAVMDLRPGLAPRWDVLVSRLTHPDPARRPASAREVRHLVAYTLAEKLPVHAPAGGVEPRDLFSLDEASFAEASPYLAGMVVGEGYELEAPLGRGGFGEVWRARRGEDAVALKLILGEEARAGLVHEAEAARRVVHPSVARLREDRSDADPPHLVFELIRGRSLRLILHEREQPLELPRALAIFDGMLEAAEACHAAGVVHMDLKPEHFLVDEPPGGPPRVRLIDFGLATLCERPSVAGSMASRPQVRGTLDYMAPEQREGRAGPPVDVYALGLCLFELLTLNLPKGPQRLRVLRRDAPPEVDRLAHEMLSPHPAARPSATQCRALLARGLRRLRGELAEGRRLPLSVSLFAWLFHRLRSPFGSLPPRLCASAVGGLLAALLLGGLFAPNAFFAYRARYFADATVEQFGRVDYLAREPLLERGVPPRRGPVLVLLAPFPPRLTGNARFPARIDPSWYWLDASLRAQRPEEVRTVVVLRRAGRRAVLCVYDLVDQRLVARYEVDGYPDFHLPGVGRTNLLDFVQRMPLRPAH